MRRLGVELIPWGVVGALVLAYHVAETRRAAGAAVVDARLRRARSRLHAVIGIARRIRSERDEVQRLRDVDVDWMRDHERHGFNILRVEDVKHLRSERDRAAAADAEACQLRVALELIADGCDMPQRIAVEALGREEEEVSCEATN